MINGRTKAAVVSAIAALAVAGIATASYYGGWKSKVGQEAKREQVIDDQLKAAEAGFARLADIERSGAFRAAQLDTLSARVDGLDTNVRRLIEAQERTNEKLDRLTGKLIDYLAAQGKRSMRVTP